MKTYKAIIGNASIEVKAESKEKVFRFLKGIYPNIRMNQIYKL